MKWKAVLCLIIGVSSFAYCQQGKEEAAIIKVLEKESATWRAKDVEGHKDCWYVQPYSRILVSLPDGKTIDVPPASKQIMKPENMGNGGFAVNSNYKMSISNSSAWVSHDELSTDAEGKRTWSYEIRLLEKIKGDWKLVGQSLHIYKREN
ncbi:endo-arabinase [Flavobacterium sp.]|uniref:endo-arabinase n=1 Tax=Flavobacterium sp. TaxID=239 RepID=UPI0008D1667A|nr:endo-arabinase [Flavobacterium sp.]OGS64926.1 MAG: endo-arabinase [Flavobacteria bacterium GWA2_35_26]HCF03487.1 endo-arabinase [Flavobacterium sp.]